MKMTDKKLYVFEYWRNDGGWHSGDYDLSPTLIFEAKDDEEARELAFGYIKVHHGEIGEDVSLEKLYEADIQIKRRNLRFRKIGKHSLQRFKQPLRRIVDRVNATDFKRLEDYVEGLLEGKRK